MLIVFALSIVPWFWLRPSRQRVRVLMVMVIGPALAGFWSQGLYYLPNPPIHYLYQFPWTISWMGSPGITSYGMVFGLEQTARVLVTVSTSMLILVTTDVGGLHLGLRAVRGTAAGRLRAHRCATVPAGDDLPDQPGPARGRAARLRPVPAALVPGHPVARLRQTGRPLRRS